MNGRFVAVKVIRSILLAFGVVFLILVALALTNLPWRAYRWLATDPARLDGSPNYIVVLGGGGIPSESGLMRTFYAADAAKRFPDAKVVVALPSDSGPATNAANRMKLELVVRGVSPERILMESQGRNTREQALKTAELIDVAPQKARVLLVTSPDHMKRALRSFRAAEFAHVAGLPAFQQSVESDLKYECGELGGSSLLMPEVGCCLMLRYGFWGNLKYEIDVARELAALAYYKLMGWI